MAHSEQPTPDRIGPMWTPSREPSRPTWGWILQAVTGALVLILVTLHMIANHFVVAGGLRDFADVVAYLSNPVVVVLEVLFLVVVTAHGLLGLRAVLFDFGLGPRLEAAITRVLAVLGVAIVAYGLWLTWTITSYH
jgi:succinate dehydrogenase hydrophobic anchor subunit